MTNLLELQFLDLDDVNKEEAEEIHNILYTSRPTRSVFPWIQEQEPPTDWSQEEQTNYEGEQSECSEEAGQEVYPVAMPVATTMQQVFPPQVVPCFMPPTYYQGGVFDERRRPRSKPSPKRNNPPVSYPLQYPATYHPAAYHMAASAVPAHSYQYMAGPGPALPSAQHAAGHPLYLAPQHIPVYPGPPHIYSQYPPPQVFNTLHDRPKHPPPPPQMEQPEVMPPPVVQSVVPPPVVPSQPDIEVGLGHHMVATGAPAMVHHMVAAPVPLPPPVITTIAEQQPASVPTEEPQQEHVQQEETQPPKVEEAVGTPAQEKVAKSLPINAIKTLALPSTMKRKPPGESVEATSPRKSWAGLFKPVHPFRTDEPVQTTPASSPPPPSTNPTPAESMQVKSKCRPPLNAVAITPPPHLVADNKQKPPTSSTAAVQQSSDDRKLAEFLLSYELEHRAVILTPRGLHNPSNYCYINATLQALLACAPFYNLIKTIAKYKQPPLANNKSNTPVIDSMIQFVNEFSPAPASSQLRQCRKEKALARKDGELDGVVAGPSFEPHYVYKMLHTVSSFLQLENRQEDAEEFLNVLLNGLNDELIELLKGVKGVGLSNGEVTANGDTHHDSDTDWKEVTTRGIRVTRRTEFGRTPLTDIFMGQLRSRVQRSDSEHSTDNVQPFFCLPLDVESSESVNEALEKLVGWDAIEGLEKGDETWQQQYLDHPPRVLILHLKCFYYSQGRPTKIAKSLDYPIDLKLDTKLVTSKSKSFPKYARHYKLFAVVYHEGKEASKGHYLADVFHVGSSGWIRYDDSTVRQVTEQELLKPRPPRVPYLLYYRRCDTIQSRISQNNPSRS